MKSLILIKKIYFNIILATLILLTPAILYFGILVKLITITYGMYKGKQYNKQRKLKIGIIDRINLIILQNFLMLILDPLYYNKRILIR